MSARFADWDERALELAAGHVTQGLDPAESAELRAKVAAADLEEFERVAAALNVAGLGRFEAPSPELMHRLAADAQRVLALDAAPGRRRLRWRRGREA